MDGDPMRLVVKNTFIDVDGEGGMTPGLQVAPDVQNRRRPTQRRSSEPAGSHGPQTKGDYAAAEFFDGDGSQDGEYIDDQAQLGTFIDDVIVTSQAAPGRRKQGKHNEVDRTPGSTNRNRQMGRSGRGGGNNRYSGGGDYQFFNDGMYGYDGGGGRGRGRRTSLQSVMTENSPTGNMFVPGAMGFMPGPPGSPMNMGAMPGGAFGMPSPASMYPQAPWGMMPPPYMGMPGMPPSLAAGAEGGKGGGGHTRTTVMLRNLPPDYKRDMVVELLNKEGFERLFDFVYMPMNLRTMASFGYVFVNLTSPIVADQCRSVFQGLTRWAIESDKVCDVLWSDEQQGLSSNVERYRNSPVMHESVPEECKPIVLAGGARVPFPAPTKRLREPRIRRPQAADGKAAPNNDGQD